MDARNIGLRNIEVADTKISSIDGENGKLIYRGYDILDLVNHSTFEETSYLLLFGELPDKTQLDEFSYKLKQSRKLPQLLITNLENRPKTAHPMDVLQSAVPSLADFDENIYSDTKEDNIKRAISLISKIPSIVSAWNRIRNGLDIIEPDEELKHSANFLYMVFGRKPTFEEEKVFDICLILHAEHSFNASTFAAREIASTRAHMYSCICGAIGALSGELHGGANVEVMKMLLDINSSKNIVEKWIQDKLNEGKRIMGMGHAVYRTTDPRADILERLAKSVCKNENYKWYEITRQVEQYTKQYIADLRKQPIYPNVDLYSASLYYCMGFPVDLNTPIFAISRISGWAAHIIEEKFAEAAPKPALYRPKAVYVGKYCGPMGCEYTPLKKRKL
ncbi:MAG TPA: citrate/2-methylcitrate synthase [Nitrososphaeraceae archaeon]|nr:citrate/2-methylcitrate synthase [Nitrososphaeraceae archaeon]